ncbi:MAG: DHHA1 domain-containing protein, partial [Bacteroidota bacterium]
SSTGKIGHLKIVSEGSVAAGVRRIEAVTAVGADRFVDEQSATLSKVNELLKGPQDTLKAIEELVQERQTLRKQVEQLQREKLSATKQKFQTLIEDHGSAKMLVAKEDFPDADGVKSIAFQLKKEHQHLIQLIGAVVNEKPLLTVMIDEELVKSQGLNASHLIREMAKSIKGGGGGQPFYATAGGKDAAGLDQALASGKRILLDQIGETA